MYISYFILGLLLGEELLGVYQQVWEWENTRTWISFWIRWYYLVFHFWAAISSPEMEGAGSAILVFFFSNFLGKPARRFDFEMGHEKLRFGHDRDRMIPLTDICPTLVAEKKQGPGIGP